MHRFKILAWNCRGLNNIETQDALVNLVRQQNPSLVFLSETLAAPDLLESVKRRIGFDGVICVPKDDNCRGLGLFWKKETPVRLRLFADNFIDVEVGEIGSTDCFRFTGIYGVADAANRMITWNILRQLAAQSDLPWLVAGDFNEVLCLEDKSGGPPRNRTAMNRFRQALVDCSLDDMGFSGPRFTWSNRLTKERLDRGCQNPQWQLMYPYSRVITLPLCRSDHCPILVEANPDASRYSKSLRNYRFEEMWLQHHECSSMVEKGWMIPTAGDAMLQVGRKIKHTGSQLMRWQAGAFQQHKAEVQLIQAKLDSLMKQPFAPHQFDEQSSPSALE